MLFLIGMGLSHREIPRNAMEVIADADEVLVDQYTNFITDEDLAKIGEDLNVSLVLLNRSDLEENAKLMVERARTKKIAILVSGDPLIATTHHTILDLAHKMKVEYRVYHAASIFSAGIGESGLDVYKFGPTTTLAFWSDNYKPVSHIDVIKRNMEAGEHTMCLLDYHYAEKRRMRLAEAVSLLHGADRQRNYNILKHDTKLIVLGDIGKETQTIAYLEIAKIGKEELMMFEGKVLTIIIPGKLNFAEEEALLKFSSHPPSST